MRKLPFENLSWVRVYERVQGDPRSKIPWDDKPLGVTNRPLYELLQNDRSLLLRLVDALYAFADIQTTLRNFSPSHADVVIKRQGIRIPKIGVIPSMVHSDIDVRVSSIGRVERRYRNRRGRCSYTDHADFHEDIPHKDNPGHTDFHLDTSQHTDQTQLQTRLLHKPLWVSRYLPPGENESVFLVGHADHLDTHLDVSFSGTAPSQSFHADRSLGGFRRDFVYLPFWRTADVQRFLSNGSLPSEIVDASGEAYGAHYDRTDQRISPRMFRTVAHGDHNDSVFPLSISYTSFGNRGKNDPFFGMYPSVLEEEMIGGLTQFITENISHGDAQSHSDLHGDEGFGFHGDIGHHDYHYDAFEHCDFTAPHADYVDHANYSHSDQTFTSQGHTDHQDHANLPHGDSNSTSLQPCQHEDSPTIHGDIAESPHTDHSDHSDFFSGGGFSPHVDSWGGSVFHSDYTKPPTHFDHMDYGGIGIWGTPVPGVPGVFVYNSIQYFVNGHYDLFSQNNHSDETLTFPPGINPHIDHGDLEDYRYYHGDYIRRPLFGSQQETHEDTTIHGDKPHTDFVFVGRAHQDVPATGGTGSHGDTVIYQDLPEAAHLDHNDHGDVEHCDFNYNGHVDVHYDVTHADHDDHANLTTSGSWHSDTPHHDHLDHSDL